MHDVASRRGRGFSVAHQPPDGGRWPGACPPGARRQSDPDTDMRSILVFLVLMGWKTLSRLLYRFDAEWVGDVPADPWGDVRIIAVLNHTSLFEPVFLALVPNRVLWRIAQDAVVPIASKTMERTGSRWAFRFAGRRVVPVSRRRDLSWEEVLRHCCGPRAITVIFPEGRMLRRSGFDREGKPMTIRGGVADLVSGVASGRMLLAYSGGLHHVQAPGDRLPRPFRTIAVRLEVISIPTYRDELGGTGDTQGFRRRVVADLTRRRNELAPVRGPTIPRWAR
jgi:1-acyl-sn-glycerol-3-phosphate acyltransferase